MRISAIILLSQFTYFLSSGDNNNKREFDERGLGSLLAKGGDDIATILGKGVASGVGSGVGGSIIGRLFGDNNYKREFDERGLGSLLVDGGEDLATILGKGIASGGGKAGYVQNDAGARTVDSHGRATGGEGGEQGFELILCIHVRAHRH